MRQRFTNGWNARTGAPLFALCVLLVTAGAGAQTTAPMPENAKSVRPPLGEKVAASKPATVAAWAEALAAPSLSGPGIPADGKKWTGGHLEIRFESGTLYPLTALDKTVGWFFVGKGHFAYTSDDLLEAATFKNDVGAASGYQLAGSTVGDEVESVLVLCPQGADRIAGTKGWPSGVTPAPAQKALADHLERFARLDGLNLVNYTTEALVDPPATDFSAAEIHGPKGEAIHLYDTIREHDESLLAVHGYRSPPSVLAHHRYAAILSKQPIGRKPLDPRPKNWDLTGVDLTLINPGGLTAHLEVHETIGAEAPVRVLDFSLFSNVLGTAGAIGKLVRNPYHLSRVTLADGTPLPFAHANDDLLVELPHPLAAGQSTTLDFSLTGDILFRPGGDSYWLLPISPWLPIPERMDQQSFTYHAIIKVAPPFIPFSDGATLRRWKEGGLDCAEFRMEKPIQFPVVLAGKYHIFSEEKKGITVRVATYVLPDRKAMKRLATNIFGLLEFYRPFLGEFPFHELDLIEINSYGFGIAPAGIIFITKEAFEPLADLTSKLFSQGINARLAHEVAHTWWGHVAKMSGPESQWLSESMAEYYSAFAMSRLERRSEMDRARREWRERARPVHDHGTVYLANQLSGFDAGRDRIGLLYAKGPLVLDALRKKLGDRVFFTICKSLLASFPFKHVHTKQFIGLTDYVTKKDYMPWFKKYLLGTDWP